MTRRLQRTLAALAVSAIAIGPSATAAAQPPVTWLIFVDDLHLDFRNTGRLRDLVWTVLKQLPLDGESIAMFSSGPSNVSVMPTTDRVLLDGQVKMLTGNGLKPEDLQASGSQREVRYRAGTARSRLLELIGRAGGAARPAIVYISNGYLAGTSAPLKTELSPPIFAIDPRPLLGKYDLDRPNWPDEDYWTATRASLRAIADASGGFLPEETDALDKVLARIAQAMRK